MGIHRGREKKNQGSGGKLTVSNIAPYLKEEFGNLKRDQTGKLEIRKKKEHR